MVQSCRGPGERRRGERYLLPVNSFHGHSCLVAAPQSAQDSTSEGPRRPAADHAWRTLRIKRRGQRPDISIDLRHRSWNGLDGLQRLCYNRNIWMWAHAGLSRPRW